MDIKDLCFKEMLDNIIPRVKITRLKNTNVDVSLFTDGSNVILFDGTNKGYFVSVPYEIRIDDNKQEIHGNTRNKLAKDFVQEYPISKIFALEQEFIEHELAAEKQFKVEKDKMLQVMQEEIFPLFPAEYAEKLEIKHWGQREVLIHFKCEYENPLDHWKGYHNNIEIYFNNHDLNSFQMLTNGKQGLCNRAKDLRLEYVKKECVRVINECLEAKEVQKEQTKESVAISKKKQAISTFSWNATVNKSVIHIIRRKNIFVALLGGDKFTVGTGKAGKYIKVKRYQIEEMIANKGYEDYCILTRDDNAWDCLFDTERLKSLEWKKVVA